MQRMIRLAALVSVSLAIQAGPARAQIYSGYGPYGGWGGYGGGWGGSTVQGDIARGLGEFAVGAGVYNDLTAQAASINADTLMRVNQFAFQAQQEANRRYLVHYRSRRDEIVRARETTDRRLREAPTPYDIASGNALNAALAELSSPRVSLNVLKRARTRLNGTLVQEIPLQYAPKAVTFSVNDLLQDGPPRVLQSAAFLHQMLETPAAHVLLAGTEGRPETDLGALLTVMNQHNLRFGVARTPRQRDVYDHLYPLLASLRDEATPVAASGGSSKKAVVLNASHARLK